jgi:hypothetical protein
MPKEIYEERQAEINRQIREGELTINEVMLANTTQFDEGNLE